MFLELPFASLLRPEKAKLGGDVAAATQQTKKNSEKKRKIQTVDAHAATGESQQPQQRVQRALSVDIFLKRRRTSSLERNNGQQESLSIATEALCSLSNPPQGKREAAK